MYIKKKCFVTSNSYVLYEFLSQNKNVFVTKIIKITDLLVKKGDLISHTNIVNLPYNV